MSKSSHRQSSNDDNAKLPPELDLSKPLVSDRRTPTGARGKRRQELILDTAAELLAEAGIEAITTNAIAANARISVGSVYQYFANKEAILSALGDYYLEKLGRNTVAALQQDVAGLSMAEMVDRVIDPMIAFERQYPAFRHFAAGQEGKGTMVEGANRVDQEVLATIYELLLRVNPELESDRAWHVARVSKALYKGMSYLVQQEREIETARGNVEEMIGDMKAMMASYLEEQLA